MAEPFLLLEPGAEHSADDPRVNASLDAGMLNGRSVLSIAISLKRIADYLQPAQVGSGADESHWLQANTDTWQSMPNNTLIEVRYVEGARSIPPLPAKLYLGEAIEWSTWATGPRRLKASIAMWRVVR